MIATIAQNQPYKLMSIKHLGFVFNGVDDLVSDKVSSWAPAYENYLFRAVPDGTQLLIEQEVAQDYVQFMSDTWPKALNKLKQLCEGNGTP
ncbi:MAG: SRPBCC domain-containing protein, partial [Rheinheimera sp.]|nr:SRPBCC domain-containing protein [Rheinheimera sp.]